MLQNQRLLIDRGVPAASASTASSRAGAKPSDRATAVARSGLGVTADGRLVWAAGEELLPAQLSAGLISAGAVRAIELDINPDWVAGYLYVHQRGGPSPAPVVPGQLGIAGALLEPYSRDFLTVWRTDTPFALRFVLMPARARGRPQGRTFRERCPAYADSGVPRARA